METNDWATPKIDITVIQKQAIMLAHRLYRQGSTVGKRIGSQSIIHSFIRSINGTIVLTYASDVHLKNVSNSYSSSKFHRLRFLSSAHRTTVRKFVASFFGGNSAGNLCTFSRHQYSDYDGRLLHRQSFLHHHQKLCHMATKHATAASQINSFRDSRRAYWDHI